MKKILLLIAIIAVVVISCKNPRGKANESADSTKVDTTAVKAVVDTTVVDTTVAK